MPPLPLLWLATEAEGPMARAEWSWATAPEVEDRRLEATLVERAAATLRADPRVADTGVRVDAGCGRARCTLALDGLAGPLHDALPALEAVVVRPPPALRCSERRAVVRSWARSARSPGRVFEAAVQRVAGQAGPGAGARPRVRPTRLAAVWAAMRTRGGRLDIAGALPEGAHLGVEALAARHPTGTAGAAPGAGPRPGVLLVDWPGAARAQVALVWATSAADTTRDALAVGDFESVLVQRLREDEALTYDVEPLYGEGWAGAAFDVAPEGVARAIQIATDELAALDRAAPARVAAAHRRLRGRALGLRDTLAGRLALGRLPPVPEAPPAQVAAVREPAVAIVGDPQRIGVSPGDVVSPEVLMFGDGRAP